MAAATAAGTSHGLTGPLGGKLKRANVGIGFMELQKKKRRVFDVGGYWGNVKCSSTMPFASPKSRFVSKQEQFFPHCTPRNSGPQSHDSPPKRDTGIANEKEWGIDMLNENVNESGTSKDGSTWYRKSGENIGENGYRC